MNATAQSGSTTRSFEGMLSKKIKQKLEMWANAQRDGRPAE